jgi:hypothetical protein
MRHSDAVRIQVCKLLRDGHPVPEVARITGLPSRTIRDIAEQEDLQPVSGKALPSQVGGEAVLGELVSIFADARATLEFISQKMRVAPAGDLPKFSTAYATILKAVSGAGVSPTVKTLDEQAESGTDLDDAFGEGAPLDMNIPRGDDAAAADIGFDDDDVARPKDNTQRERLLRTHMDRAAQATDPAEKARLMMAALGGEPPLSPGDIARMRLEGEIAVMGGASAHGVPDG